MISLRISFADMCESRTTIPRSQLRDIFREFARLSPRPNSPTSAMSLEDVRSELLQMESNAASRDNAAAVETDGAGGTTSSAADIAEPMEVDDNDNMEVDTKPVVYGPRTHDESLLEDIHTQRDRMLREIREHRAEAYNTGSQEQIWYWEDQENWWMAAIEAFSNVIAICGASMLCGDICMWWYLSMVYIYIYIRI